MWTSPAFYAAVLGLIGAATALIRTEMNRLTIRSHMNAKHSAVAKDHYGSPTANPLQGE
jgi:hypothetical protein